MRFVCAVLVVCFVISASNYRCVQADDFDPGEFSPARLQEYERQLNAILKTRRDQEKDFVRKVVEQVRDGKIPSKLIQTSFKWVKNKRPDTQYPFIYFEHVIRRQAKLLKLEKEIPAFDYSIYGSAGQRAIGQSGFAGQRTKTQRDSIIRSTQSQSAGQRR